MIGAGFALGNKNNERLIFKYLIEKIPITNYSGIKHWV
jgi:hypothetical protein